MKTHIQTRKLVLQHSPLVLHIARENGSGKLGRAVIREGSFTWYPGSAQKGHKISWARLGELIKYEVPKRRRRKVAGI
jgi:hypothetical protein